MSGLLAVSSSTIDRMGADVHAVRVVGSHQEARGIELDTAMYTSR